MHLVFTASTSDTEPFNHPLSPHAERLRSATNEAEVPRDSMPKPRSRRCFVCGMTGQHPLDFRVCPRTAVLLRRSLAKIDDDGRLVSPDGSPLPMTRHPGGVAAHLISRFRNPTRTVAEQTSSSRTPPSVHVPPRPTSIEPRDHPSSPGEFDLCSPHAIPPHVEPIIPAPDHVPYRRTVPQYDFALAHHRASFISTLFASILENGFRSMLRSVILILDKLYAEDPSTFRQRMHPVFTRISHFPQT
ncbi:hypothetical protein MSAN_01629300 [Mycena sanguinolenta]|uniref:Uncharacterized protein n=1 Tax=Mycena sanguinolenta TaxID=230812 RepID=A0A8H6XYJ8_9AGAR|nr:hypothetical protein MSAN_01629300 [Mycena sanguinolenta]